VIGNEALCHAESIGKWRYSSTIPDLGAR
jgi:hypothetical protein